ncbi:MAG: transcriptional repressor [Verrucomicrobiota bacterium]
MKTDTTCESRLAEELGDFRMTKQRRVVYDVLMSERDHPTASEVFDRTRSRVPSISLATVYNCLETLTQCGLVKQVNVDREASRYCPNLREHAHFFCESCGEVSDVVLKEGMEATGAWELPRGSVVDHVEFAIKGFCPKCSGNGD